MLLIREFVITVFILISFSIFVIPTAHGIVEQNEKTSTIPDIIQYFLVTDSIDDDFVNKHIAKNGPLRTYRKYINVLCEYGRFEPLKYFVREGVRFQSIDVAVNFDSHCLTFSVEHLNAEAFKFILHNMDGKPSVKNTKAVRDLIIKQRTELESLLYEN